MNKTVFGVLVGAGLGLIDGLSAWMSPEARSMMTLIVIGSTLKGVLTGAAAGFVVQRWRSLPLGIATGLGVGFVLSTVAAQGQPGHYWEIVLPGMLVGLLTGVITQRYPRDSTIRDRSRVSGMIILVTLTVAATLSASTQTTTPPDPLSLLEPFIGRWEGTSEGSESLSFTTQAIENIPEGWRARETYTFLSADEFEEVFELAEPKKDFAVYSRSRLRRLR